MPVSLIDQIEPSCSTSLLDNQKTAVAVDGIRETFNRSSRSKKSGKEQRFIKSCETVIQQRKNEQIASFEVGLDDQQFLINQIIDIGIAKSSISKLIPQLFQNGILDEKSVVQLISHLSTTDKPDIDLIVCVIDNCDLSEVILIEVLVLASNRLLDEDKFSSAILLKSIDEKLMLEKLSLLPADKIQCIVEVLVQCLSHHLFCLSGEKNGVFQNLIGKWLTIVVNGSFHLVLSGVAEIEFYKTLEKLALQLEEWKEWRIECFQFRNALEKVKCVAGHMKHSNVNSDYSIEMLIFD